MKIIALILFFFPLLCYGQACTEADLDGNPNPLNCTTLTVGAAVNMTGINTVDNQPYIINVSGNVTINANVQFDGANGASPGGFLQMEVALPGRWAGGSCTNAGVDCTVKNGVGTGKGFGGAGGDSQFVGQGSGGGGGGAAFGTNGSPGDAGVGTNGGLGGALGNGSSTNYGSQSTWDSSFVGGSGGGAGGYGDAGAQDQPSGAGGGGGGAVKIIAGGDITINAILSSNGGDGGVGADDTTADAYDAGCGGGGSGGAIWLQAAGDIDVSGGNINVSGGNGGNCAAHGGGDGGAGGFGRVRLEDQDGVIVGIANVNDPTPLVQVYGGNTTSDSAVQNFSSDIACGSVTYVADDDDDLPPWGGFFVGFAFVFVVSSLKNIRKLS